MNLQQISKKYGISDNYLNSKDDAHEIASTSLIDLKEMILKDVPRDQIANKIQFLADFLRDVKNSSY
jgi:hypothetical protein